VPGPRPLVQAQGMALSQELDPQALRKEVIPVTVSIPLVVIFAVIVYIAYRYMGLRIWHAIVSLILGFLLAATTAAPEIRHLLFGLLQWIQRP
jgi:hypothetical protein